MSILEFDIYDVQRAINGDRKSLEVVLKKTYLFSYHYFKKQGLSYTYIEDLVQDVSIHVLEKLCFLRNYKTFFGWLITTCRRTLIDLKRKLIVRKCTVSINQYFDLEDKSSTAHTIHLEKLELTLLLNNKIEKLPDKHKQILSLYYFGNKQTPQISKELGMSLTTVARHLHQAKDKLKEMKEMIECCLD